MIEEAKNGKADSLRRIADALEKIANEPSYPHAPYVAPFNPSYPYIYTPAPLRPYVGDLPPNWWGGSVTSAPNTTSGGTRGVYPFTNVSVSMAIS